MAVRIVPDVTVIGGVNVDIGGRSFSSLIPRDSNPGSITVSAGGVGRNIAQNLCQLGLQVSLISAWGDDTHGRLAASACVDAGMDISQVRVLSSLPTSTYLYISNPEGEMALALSDMAAADRVTPGWLEERQSLLDSSRVIVADTNIPADSLRYLAEHSQVPLFIDPVSVTKAEKLRPILARIHTLKPNRYEAELLSGVPIHSRDDALHAAHALIDLGVKRVFLSLGAEGVCAVSGDQELFLPCLSGIHVNSTGCGDSFMAAIIWAWLRNMSPRDTTLAGLAAAAITMESVHTISPVLNPDTLCRRMAL